MTVAVRPLLSHQTVLANTKRTANNTGFIKPHGATGQKRMYKHNTSASFSLTQHAVADKHRDLTLPRYAY
ncbi:hypothetical protein XENOCAPTIV_014746 [Xenoophorus captivus]|uniref:Uncharacterized protein n=1 Tax=Xenoophorus captivus TaxID=1517983 RepID=A0ABV0S707_9TELE